MALLTKETAYVREFLMVLSSDSKTGATGKTVTVTLSKAGAAFAAAAGSVAEVGSGWYAITLTTQDTNTLGDLAYHCTAANCDDTDFVDEVRTAAQIAAIEGTTTAFSSSMTRNELIEMAYKDIGVLADGENLSDSLLSDGIKKLNALMREIDATGKWLWTEKSTSIRLVSNQFVYTSADTGFPTDMREVDRVTYRDGQAQDWPVEILTREGYEALNNKTQQGDPSKAWLTVTRAVGDQTMYVWPMLGTVNSQSQVIGSDSLNYLCIRSHTSDSTTKPITGANWQLYWQRGGSAGTAWADSTSYTAPQLLILWYRRPLYDFASASDNPDMPTQWTRLLEYRLASDLADLHGNPIEERIMLSKKAEGSYSDIFKSLKPQGNDWHNKASYI